jgi:hypothetical protein
MALPLLRLVLLPDVTGGVHSSGDNALPVSTSFLQPVSSGQVQWTVGLVSTRLGCYPGDSMAGLLG